jgi:hypothetical protein
MSWARWFSVWRRPSFTHPGEDIFVGKCLGLRVLVVPAHDAADPQRFDVIVAPAEVTTSDNRAFATPRRQPVHAERASTMTRGTRHGATGVPARLDPERPSGELPDDSEWLRRQWQPE